MEIPEHLTIHETNFWALNHRIDSVLPGYLILGSLVPADEFSDLTAKALLELGPLLAKTQAVLKSLLKPVRIYVGRYGHLAGHPVHFHVMPVYDWVERLFWSDDRYRVLDGLSAAGGMPRTDGAQLTLFIWREFCEQAARLRPEGPTVAEAIALLREGMSG